jgi:hypothetical protein
VTIPFFLLPQGLQAIAALHRLDELAADEIAVTGAKLPEF